MRLFPTSTARCYLLVVALILAGIVPAVINAQWFDDSGCLLEEMPIVLLSKDPETGMFTLVDRDDTGLEPKDEYNMEDEILVGDDHLVADGAGGRRHRSVVTSNIRNLEFSSYTTSSLSYFRERSGDVVVPGLLLDIHGNDDTTASFRRRINTNTSTVTEDDVNSNIDTTSNETTSATVDSPVMRYRARECNCFVPDYPVVYCPLTVKTCNLPSQAIRESTTLSPEGFPPGCLTSPNGRGQAKQITSFVTIWLIILFFSIIVTDRGHKCIRYIVSSTCCPKCDKRLVDKMMDDPVTRDQAMAMIQHHLIRERRRRRQRVRNINSHADVANAATVAAFSALGAAGGNLRQQIEVEMATVSNTDNGNTRATTNNSAGRNNNYNNTTAASFFQLTTTTAPLALSARAVGAVTPSDETMQQLQRQQRQHEEPPAPTIPKSLVLRTRIYRMSSSELIERQHDKKMPSQQSRESMYSKMSSSVSGVSKISSSLEGTGHGDAMTHCTICLVPLKDGDRVGALPCDHLFHVTCLKSWLPRRNVCPLCQNDQVATPVYDDHERKSGTRGDAGGSRNHSELQPATSRIEQGEGEGSSAIHDNDTRPQGRQVDRIPVDP